jgi:hypothetical protein
MEHIAGMIEPIIGCFAAGCRPADAGHAEYCDERHNFFHVTHHFLPMRSVMNFLRTEAHKVILRLVGFDCRV